MKNGRRTDRIITFTKAKIAALAVPDAGRRGYYHDANTPGLCVCVTDTGTRTFYLYRRIEGKPERVRIGRFPTTTIEQARRQHARLCGKIAEGHNPQAEKRRARGDLTLGELYNYYHDTYCEPHGRNPDAEYRYRLHLSRWADRKLSSISRQDVQDLHRKLGDERGKVTANHAIGLLRAMVNYAIRNGRWTGDNPAAGVRKFEAPSRDRFLEGDELVRWFKALKDEPSDLLRDFFLLSLFTGARRSNTQAMGWADVHLDRRVWLIPPDQAKAGKPITVHLSDPAVQVLERRRGANRNGSQWVFPSRGKSGHLQEPKIAWGRLLERAKIKDLRMHDLRRTLGSWQALTGASLQVIGKSLGHASTEATEIYARLNSLDPVRDSVDRATAAMLATANGDDDAESEG